MIFGVVGPATWNFLGEQVQLPYQQATQLLRNSSEYSNGLMEVSQPTNQPTTATCLTDNAWWSFTPLVRREPDNDDLATFVRLARLSLSSPSFLVAVALDLR
jgi:hypothetical protein